jgi:hypothetical protein
MRFNLVAEWHRVLWRAWSARWALILAFLNAAVLGLAAFVDVLNPWMFLILNIVGYGAIALLRIFKQPEQGE